jgi:hypothetical protein
LDTTNEDVERVVCTNVGRPSRMTTETADAFDDRKIGGETKCRYSEGDRNMMLTGFTLL